MTGRRNRLIRSFRGHPKKLFSVFIFLVLVSSIVIFENFTNPSSQVPDYKIKSVPYGTLGSTNGTTFPENFNETSDGFRVVFEILPGPPLAVIPGLSTSLFFRISYFNLTGIPFYTSATFQITNANFTIGSYTMRSWSTGCYYDNTSLFYVNFKLGPSITSYDLEGQNYSGEGNITVVPIIHFGIFHIAKTPFILHFNTPYPWYYIKRVSTTIFRQSPISNETDITNYGENI